MSFKCSYCGSSRKKEDDHIMAQIKGGVTTTPACLKCNRSKSSKGFVEWLKFLKNSKEPKHKYRVKRMLKYHSTITNKFTERIKRHLQN